VHSREFNGLVEVPVIVVVFLPVVGPIGSSIEEEILNHFGGLEGSAETA
jgi:hypothetical protein